MSSVKLIQVNDVHIQDQQYGSRVDDCIETVTNKLTFVYEYAEEHGADVVITGDLFNKKSPWRVSHYLVNYLANFFDAWYAKGVKTYLIAGTHDMANGRIESLSRQPFGNLLRASKIEYIAPGANICEQDGTEFVIWGAPGIYNLDHEDGQQAYVFPADVHPEIENRVTVSHGMLLRPSESFFDHYTSMAWVAKSTSAALHLNGHPHWYMGFTNLKAKNSPSGACLFSNIGSLYRVSAAKENQTRDILVGYFEIENGEVVKAEEVKVPYVPFEDVFVESVQATMESEYSSLEDLVDLVGQATEDLASATTADEMTAFVKKNMDPSPAVLEKVEYYLGMAEEQL